MPSSMQIKMTVVSVERMGPSKAFRRRVSLGDADGRGNIRQAPLTSYFDAKARLSSWPRVPIVRAKFGLSPQTGISDAHGRREKSRAGLFGRPRHLNHTQVVADHVWLRGGDVYRRSRPGRGARAGARQGATAWYQAGEHLHRGFAR